MKGVKHQGVGPTESKITCDQAVQAIIDNIEIERSASLAPPNINEVEKTKDDKNKKKKKRMMFKKKKTS